MNPTTRNFLLCLALACLLLASLSPSHALAQGADPLKPIGGAEHTGDDGQVFTPTFVLALVCMIVITILAMWAMWGGGGKDK